MCGLSLVFEKTGLIEDHSRAKGAFLAGLFFVIFWFYVGAIIIRSTASKLKHWYEIEKNVLDVDYLKAKKLQYEKLYYNLGSCSFGKIPENLIRELEHLVMRLQFLNPIYLPALTESFLRKDFNFASYLAKVSAKNLNEFFFMHWAPLLLALPLISLCMLSFGNIELIHNFIFGGSK